MRSRNDLVNIKLLRIAHNWTRVTLCQIQKKKKKKKKNIPLTFCLESSVNNRRKFIPSRKKKTKRFVSACQIKLLHPLSLPRVWWNHERGNYLFRTLLHQEEIRKKIHAPLVLFQIKCLQSDIDVVNLGW